MPLPTKAGTQREFADLRRREISDPGFDVPAVVYLRPLLSTEIEAADEEARLFVRQYFTGGFLHPTTEKWTEKPMPLLVDGEPVPLTPSQAVTMHRYEAMQRPMRGKPPEHQSLITVADMVTATVMHDTFWRGFEAFASEVWNEGESGKAWGRSPASAPPDDGSPNEA